MLNLDMKAVCKLAAVGKRTLTEFESGRRTISDVTRVKIKAFYISKGIEFSDGNGNDQVVSLKHFYLTELVDSGEIREKIEHLDIFGVHDIDGAFQSLEDTLHALNGKIAFSRKLLLECMKKKGINQKQLALLLGCSPSFINSIIVGKKLIPASMIDKLELFYREPGVNIQLAIACEKNIKTNIMAATKLAMEAKKEINLLYK